MPNSNLKLRRNYVVGQGDSNEDVAIVPHSTLRFNQNGLGINEPLLTSREIFERLPVVTTVVATSAYLTLLLGTNTPVAAQSAKGGVDLTTGGTATNQAAVAGIVNTGLSAALSVTNLVEVRCRMRVAAVTGLFASFALNSLATDVDPTATAGDGASIILDPTNSLTATTGATAAQALNLILHYKVNGADTFAFTDIPVVAAQDYDFHIKVNADYTASVYVNGVLKGTSPALTAGAVVKPIAGVETTATATAACSVRFMSLARQVGV